ncbi:MAG TPA: sterol desaturase family protein [Myxococcales bacterium]|nr:sterol desaturase family protein [Myxococcales bacterium]
MTFPLKAALLLMAAALSLEAALSAWRGLRLFRLRDTLTNVAMYAGYLAVILFWGQVTYFAYDAVHEYALFDLGMEGPLARLWAPAPWILLAVLEELTFYAFHRASHRCSLLWAAHQAHHSSDRFNLSTALRQSWAPFLATPFWLPLPWLGFDPAMVLWVQGLSLLYQFFLHTELVPSFGPLDGILNSPHHHRAHHGRAERFHDRNFGGWSIVWDRLFGSFTAAQPEAYGIGDAAPAGPLSAELGPWLRLGRDALHAGSLLAAGRAVLGRPGGASNSLTPAPRSLAP